MTFEEWWEIHVPVLVGHAAFLNTKGCCEYTYVHARMGAIEEICEYIKERIKWYKDMNGKEAAIAVLQDLLTTLEANLDRGGQWATSVIMDCQGEKDPEDGSCSCYGKQ